MMKKLPSEDISTLINLLMAVLWGAIRGVLIVTIFFHTVHLFGALTYKLIPSLCDYLDSRVIDNTTHLSEIIID